MYVRDRCVYNAWDRPARAASTWGYHMVTWNWTTYIAKQQKTLLHLRYDLSSFSVFVFMVSEL